MKIEEQRIDSKVVFQGRSFFVAADTVRLANGKEIVRGVVRHRGAVVILPIDAEGAIIAIRQYRHALGRVIIELPAGTLEPGEDPFVCAKREIVEEPGNEAADWVPLGVQYPTPGFCDELQHCYLARTLTPAFREKDEDEMIEIYKLSVAEFEKGILSGDIIDAKSISTVMKARVAGLI